MAGKRKGRNVLEGNSCAVQKLSECLGGSRQRRNETRLKSKSALNEKGELGNVIEIPIKNIGNQPPTGNWRWYRRSFK